MLDMTNQTKAKRRPPTRGGFEAALEIYPILKEKLRFAKDGHVEYDEGWDDARVAGEVAAKLGRDIAESTVAYVRTAKFGKLRRVAWNKADANVSREEIIALFKRQGELKAKVEKLRTALGYAADALGEVEIVINSVEEEVSLIGLQIAKLGAPEPLL